MTIYLINYATVADFDEDNGDFMDLEEMAMPRGIVITDLNRLPIAQQVALEEMIDCNMDDDPTPGTYTWHSVALETVISSSDYLRFDLHRNGAFYGVMIVRKMEPV